MNRSLENLFLSSIVNYTMNWMRSWANACLMHSKVNFLHFTFIICGTNLTILHVLQSGYRIILLAVTFFVGSSESWSYFVVGCLVVYVWNECDYCFCEKSVDVAWRWKWVVHMTWVDVCCFIWLTLYMMTCQVTFCIFMLLILSKKTISHYNCRYKPDLLYMCIWFFC